MPHHVVLRISCVVIGFAACHDSRVRQVYVREPACCRHVVASAPHHLSQAAQVVTIQRPGYGEVGVVVQVLAHQRAQLAWLAQQQGVARGEGDRLAHRLAHAARGVGPYHVGGVAAQVGQQQRLPFLVFAVVLEHHSLLVGGSGGQRIQAASLRDRLATVVRDPVAYDHAHRTMADDARFAQRGFGVGQRGEAHPVAPHGGPAVGALEHIVVGGGGGEPCDACRHHRLVVEDCRGRLLHGLCRAISEVQLRHLRLARHRGRSVERGLRPCEICGRLRGEARFQIVGLVAVTGEKANRHGCATEPPGQSADPGACQQAVSSMACVWVARRV